MVSNQYWVQKMLGPNEKNNKKIKTQPMNTDKNYELHVIPADHAEI